MKGLDWFKVASNIAVDGDLCHVSDGAFRTFIELIGISSMHLSDGRVSILDAVKMCNSRYARRNLAELSAAGHVILDAEYVTIRCYAKYQPTRAEIEARRESERERVRSYRKRTTPVVREQSKSKSKSLPLTNVSGANDWVAAWVDALAEAGEEPPLPSAKAIFGAKVKSIKNLDCAIMADAISRMVSERKSPGLLAHVYGDCAKAAEQEVWNMKTGVRRVR